MISKRRKISHKQSVVFYGTLRYCTGPLLVNGDRRGHTLWPRVRGPAMVIYVRGHERPGPWSPDQNNI